VKCCGATTQNKQKVEKVIGEKVVISKNKEKTAAHRANLILEFPKWAIDQSLDQFRFHAHKFGPHNSLFS
jgi:hypothetical protein